jgi:ornithine cyclodeaminase/alanine dehydrogenase-like protein (mu-crystallin family)
VSTKAPLFIPLDLTKELISVRDVLDITEDVFRMRARDEISLCEPARFTIRGRETPIYSHVKGCVLEGVPVMGVRVVAYYVNPDGSGTSAPGSTRLVVLTDPRNGQLLAIVDEHWNYSIRTTAAAVIGAKYLARRESHNIGIVGAGNLARTGLIALCETFPVTQVRVISRTRASSERFSQEMQEHLRVPVETRPTIEDVCQGADIIFVATTSNKPLVRTEWVAPTTCLVTVGNDEIDHSLYGTVDKFVVDDKQEVGRSLRPVVEAGLMREDGFHAEIWEVVVGRKPGRQRPEERTLIRTVGLVAQDVAVANYVYQRAVATRRGMALQGGV